MSTSPPAPDLPGDSGMTLVELMVVLAILGLAATLALPGFRGAGRTVEVRTAAHDLAGTLRAARAEAISRGGAVAVSFDTARRAYRTGDRTVRLPGDVAVAVTTASVLMRDAGDARLLFYPDGSSSGGRITLARDAHRATVAVDWLTGHVAIEAGP